MNTSSYRALPLQPFCIKYHSLMVYFCLRPNWLSRGSSWSQKRAAKLRQELVEPFEVLSAVRFRCSSDGLTSSNGQLGRIIVFLHKPFIYFQILTPLIFFLHKYFHKQNLLLVSGSASKIGFVASSIWTKLGFISLKSVFHSLQIGEKKPLRKTPCHAQYSTKLFISTKITQGEGPARLPVTKAIKLINHFCFETVIRE